MSQNQERRIGKITIGCLREYNRVHRLPQDATTLKIPAQQHRETDCDLRCKKVDDDMISLLSLGVKLFPNLVTRVKENLKSTFGKSDLKNFSTNIATWPLFERDCMRGSFQMSRKVETYTRGCQNVSSRIRRIFWTS